MMFDVRLNGCSESMVTQIAIDFRMFMQPNQRSVAD